MKPHLPRALALSLATLLLPACDGGPQPPPTEPTAAAEGDPFTSRQRSGNTLALASEWQPVPDDGVELGLGYDSREGRIVPNRCVLMAPVHSPGQVTELSLDEVSSRAQVMDALKLSAAASVKTMFASGSATASFARSTQTSSQSTTLLLNATVANGTLFAGPVGGAAAARSAFPDPATRNGAGDAPREQGRLTLQPWAKALLAQPEEFRAYCGDGYVSAITSGARLLASFAISGTSSSERRTTAATIKGSYGPANVSGSANASKGSESSMNNVSVRYMQVGGAKGPIATTTEALRDKLATLASEALASPRFQDMRVTPYGQMAEVRGAQGWRDSDDEFALIADTYWQLTSLEQDVRTVLDHYGDKIGIKDAKGKAVSVDAYVKRSGRDEQGLRDFLDDILQTRRAIFDALDGEANTNTTGRLDEAPVQLFAQAPPASTLQAPPGILLRQLRGSPDLGALASALNRALPFGNPLVLLINLPLPGAEWTGPEGDDEALRRAVVAHYIAPAAQRACHRNPTDRACFTQRELDHIAALVPVRPAR